MNDIYLLNLVIAFNIVFLIVVAYYAFVRLCKYFIYRWKNMGDSYFADFWVSFRYLWWRKVLFNSVIIIDIFTATILIGNLLFSHNFLNF